MTIANALLVDDIRKHPDGRVDLVGLFEDIHFPNLPVQLESVSLFVDLVLAPEDRGQVRLLEISVLDPTGKAIQEPTRIKFTVPRSDQYDRDTAQLDLALFELPFHDYGPHRIDIRSEGSLVRTLPLRILPG